MPRKRKQHVHLAKLASAKRSVLPNAILNDGSTDGEPNSLSDVESESCYLVDSAYFQEEELERVLVNTIRWVEGAGEHFRKAYTGDSRATKYRRQTKANERLEISSKCRSITDFFNPIPVSNEAEFIDAQSKQSALPRAEMLEKAIESIGRRTQTRKRQSWEHKDTQSKYDYIRHIAVHRYLVAIKHNHLSKMASSMAIAKSLYPADNCDYRARTLREWGKFYIDNHELPETCQGRHVKTKSLIDDEDVQHYCRAWLRSQIPDAICGRSFALWIRESLHLHLNYTHPIVIHERTAQRWLHCLSFAPEVYRQGLYFDGHERSDVVEYRKRFLDEMSAFQRRMFTFAGDDLETAIRPDLVDDERSIVLDGKG
jgi:hypothetical protein